MKIKTLYEIKILKYNKFETNHNINTIITKVLVIIIMFIIMKKIINVIFNNK